MKFFIALNVFLLSAFITRAQCLKGDCKNGYGKFDYGYAVYEGAFKNGEPNGVGTLDYGEGEKYIGEFAGGKENGQGLMYRKDGSYEAVQYIDGQLQRKEKIIIIGGNIIVEGCLSGNCKEGAGTLIFPSGNKYAGNFANYQPQGAGRFTFADGNIIEGTFENGVFISGKLTYSTGEVFTGTFNADGTPKTGKYLLTTRGDAVDIVDNKTATIKNIDAEQDKKTEQEISAHNRLYKPCPACGGKGGTMTQDSWKSSKKTYTGTIYDEYEVTTRQGPPHVSTCIKCWGKGEVKR